MKNNIDEEDINWVKLFLKVILLFVAILLIIWLVSKFILKNSADTSDDFEANLESMYEVAFEYFSDDSKLPNDGEHVTLTLSEMIEKGLIATLKDGSTTCSNKSSYAKVSNQGGKYTLKVLLTCGSNSDYKESVIKDTSNKESDTTSDQETSNSQSGTISESNSSQESSGGNSQSSSSNSGTSTTTSETKVVTDYTTREYKFCKIATESYQTVIYLKTSDITKGAKFTYSVQLSRLDQISKVTIGQDSYFVSKTYYEKYLSQLDNNFTIVNGNSAAEVISNLSTFVSTSLKSSNFDYELSEVYDKDGSYYVDVTITIKKSGKNSTTYNSTKINYVPVSFTVRYADLNQCVTDTFKNSYKYANYYVIVN